MVQLVSITEEQDPELMSIAAGLARQMEGGRQFVRAVQVKDKGSITFQQLPGGMVRAIVESVSVHRVIGWVEVLEGTDLACVWEDDGEFSYLPVPDTSVRTRATGISRSGKTIAGFIESVSPYACMWDDGVFRTLPVPGEVTVSEAYGIAASGNFIVGRAVVSSTEHPCIWSKGASWGEAEFSYLPIPDGMTSANALVVSSDGKVVAGRASDSVTMSDEAYIWAEGTPAVLFSPPAMGRPTLSSISASGKIIAGDAYDGPNPKAAKWVDGAFSFLTPEGDAAFVSPNGKVFVGATSSGICVWREDEQSFLSLPEGATSESFPGGVSTTGRAIAGTVAVLGGPPILRPCKWVNGEPTYLEVPFEFYRAVAGGISG
jgi:uncharacterized membrane protein